MSKCPCGSNTSFEKCCQPYLEGKAKAPTAEALLRARYTAFTKVDMDFIQRSHHHSTRQQLDVKGTEQWAKSAEWNGLEILQIEAGAEGDREGQIEFKAHYRIKGKDCVLHELSQFTFKDEWQYIDSRLPDVKQYKRETPKIGRNDPCVCGSGKKYKKCCGAKAAA